MWEEAKHIARREQIITARGERAKGGDNRYSSPATVAGLKTTGDLAEEAGMSERMCTRTQKHGSVLQVGCNECAVEREGVE
jgi:hypothetical protein